MHPAGILQNTATGRFHPIVFRCSPRPSEEDEDICRFKSIGHHTEGFEDKDKAEEFIREKKFGETGLLWEWDGTGTPALTWQFSSKEYE